MGISEATPPRGCVKFYIVASYIAPEVEGKWIARRITLELSKHDQERVGSTYNLNRAAPLSLPSTYPLCQLGITVIAPIIFKFNPPYSTEGDQSGLG